MHDLLYTHQIPFLDIVNFTEYDPIFRITLLISESISFSIKTSEEVHNK